MIQKIRIVGEIAVVTATADFHPLRQLKQLSSELESLHFEGAVLFDLLAVNGLTDNRFASMKFHRNEFDRSSFALESDVNPGIKSEQDDFAKHDHTFLLGSVLSSSEIEKFTH
ncbi:TPA: type II toxin-antitoxin system RnlB family antitoxin [Pseudomonas aeruginosa]|uniref:type II toxin-antitoxin system RnlB family antitoxin n=1 Tax=Pseudomonas aeruginosa TaxID=287 RepID=UPI0015DAB46E|nr:type II toxin-antitoxin system RnlB family antitoxin [Pseudomonas aeruginosa]HDQ4328768.1 type II toxin-antitoxin system RnlB family antitoxin [Pseudomonas aeruginosa]HEJ3435288.1 type II toxin-antitoxin system RnlB family antitoxin [Pseudomonas aeruginosa]HEJ6311063.1 type II toxin-antitoxin system RnlB family antitoxin [Pseudomonas aeruginosa]